eukprot:4819524-Pleurochrysis_carterae.AAC.1
MQGGVGTSSIEFVSKTAFHGGGIEGVIFNIAVSRLRCETYLAIALTRSVCSLARHHRRRGERHEHRRRPSASP